MISIDQLRKYSKSESSNYWVIGVICVSEQGCERSGRLISKQSEPI
jgi:hypothetical protein